MYLLHVQKIFRWFKVLLDHHRFWIALHVCWPEWPTGWQWSATENSMHKLGHYSVWPFKNLGCGNKQQAISLLTTSTFATWAAWSWQELGHVSAHTHHQLLILTSACFLPVTLLHPESLLLSAILLRHSQSVPWPFHCDQEAMEQKQWLPEFSLIIT